MHDLSMRLDIDETSDVVDKLLTAAQIMLIRLSNSLSIFRTSRGKKLPLDLVG